MEQKISKRSFNDKIQFHKQEYQNQYDLSIAAFKPLKKAIAYSTATKL